MWREHHTAKEIEREIGDWKAALDAASSARQETSPPSQMVLEAAKREQGTASRISCCALGSARRSARRHQPETRPAYGCGVSRAFVQIVAVHGSHVLMQSQYASSR